MVRGFEMGPRPGAQEMSAEEKLKKLQAAVDKKTLESAATERRRGRSAVEEKMRKAVVTESLGKGSALDSEALSHAQRVAGEGGLEELASQGGHGTRERVTVSNAESPDDEMYRAVLESNTAAAREFASRLPEKQRKEEVTVDTTESDADEEYRRLLETSPSTAQRFVDRARSSRKEITKETIAPKAEKKSRNFGPGPVRTPKETVKTDYVDVAKAQARSRRDIVLENMQRAQAEQDELAARQNIMAEAGRDAMAAFDDAEAEAVAERAAWAETVKRQSERRQNIIMRAFEAAKKRFGLVQEAGEKRKAG